MKQFIEKNFKVILLIFCVLFFIQQCSTSRKSEKAYKQAKLTQESLDSLLKNGPVNAEQVKHISQQTMFEFLIYEEDVDKGRTSLSDIKNKIEKK
jgi:hypothetical protein